MTLSERNVFKKASEAGHLKYQPHMRFFLGGVNNASFFLMPISCTFTPKYDLLVSSAFALLKFFFSLSWKGSWTSRRAWGFPPFVLFLCCALCFPFHLIMPVLHIASKNQAIVGICNYFEFDIAK